MITTTVSLGIEGHTKVSGPKWFVDAREVKIHLGKAFNVVVSWLNSQVSHLTQPEVHSFGSPVSISVEEAAVSFDKSTKRSIVGRHIAIIHQIMHHIFCQVNSSHLSSPTREQQVVCHDIWTQIIRSLHLLEQVHCTIHVLQLDPTLHECGVSTNARSQSCSSHRSKN